MSIDYNKIPVDYMQDAVKRWVEHGVMPGSFLRAVLENNLQYAVGNADSNNLAALRQWVEWFYNYAPARCWGTLLKVRAWQDHQGLEGLLDAAENETSRT